MQLKIYLILFGWWKFSLCNELFKVQSELENDVNVRTKNADCINAIVSKYFTCRKNIKIYASNDDFSFVYESISTGYCYNVGYVHSKTCIWTEDGYIIYVRNITTFFKTMRRIRKNKRWNPRAKFIIKIKENLEESDDYDIFNALRDLNIFNVILLKDRNDGIEMFTYFAYGDGSCGNRIVNITSFGYCNEHNNVDLFPNKLNKAWQNCTVSVAVSEEPPFVISKENKDFQFLDNIEGLEQYMLTNIGKKENIFINYFYVPRNVRYGIILPNGTYTGSLVYLQNKTADIAAGAFILIKNRAEILDIISGYSNPTIKVYTAAVSDETWKNVYKPFGTTVWVLIILTYIVFSIAIIIVSYYVTGNEDYAKVMLRVIGYLFTNIDNDLIRVPRLGRFMIIWIFFALLICSFYNTAFYSVLTGKKTTSISMYDEKYTSFMTPCVTDAIQTFFQYSYNETLTTDSSPDCRDIETALAKVAESKNFYTIYLDYNYKFKEYKYIDKHGHKKLDAWDYSSNYMLTMYAVRGFPFLGLFRRYVNYFFESGLTKKHLDDIYFKSQLLRNNPVHRFNPVTLSDCRIHFGLLLFGVVISIICFVIELNQRQINYAV